MITRLLIALLCVPGPGVPGLGTAALAAPARDWRQTVTQAADGAYRIGNPSAKVKLTEYLSYTCPHCAHFLEESQPELSDRMVARGLVQIELRNLVLNPLDMAAATLARCAGPDRFWPITHRMFKRQPQWSNKGIAYIRASVDSLEKLPPASSMERIARHSGLVTLAREAGMPTSAVTPCFADKRAARAVSILTEDAATRVAGTPSFQINGGPVFSDDWAGLKKRLVAAGVQ